MFLGHVLEITSLPFNVLVRVRGWTLMGYFILGHVACWAEGGSWDCCAAAIAAAPQAWAHGAHGESSKTHTRVATLIAPGLADATRVATLIHAGLLMPPGSLP